MNLQLPKDDKTFETRSQMIFTATRFENSALIECKADNIVMRDEKDRPLHESINLEVLCKWSNDTSVCEKIAWNLNQICELVKYSWAS